MRPSCRKGAGTETRKSRDDLEATRSRGGGAEKKKGDQEMSREFCLRFRENEIYFWRLLFAPDLVCSSKSVLLGWRVRLTLESRVARTGLEKDSLIAAGM